ncbi:MAG TPA: DUF748 domain-containing protein [Methylophilaceae bacterium]
MNLRLKKILSGTAFKIVASVIAGYFLFAYFAVNPLAKRLLPWVAEKQLASRITVDNVEFDPLRLILRVHNLQLTRPDGAPLAGFDRLFVNLESSGIFDYAWKLKDIRLSKPQVLFEVAPDGKLNWADLIAKLNEDKQPDTGMARVLIEHMLIEGGNLQYIERNRATPYEFVLKPLDLALDGLSTLPKDRGDYLISAKLPEQGGTLKWKGSLALNPVVSTGSVSIEGVNLAKLLQVLGKQALPVNVTAGELMTNFNYHFAMEQVAINPPALNKPNTQTEKASLATYPKATLENFVLNLRDVAGELNKNAENPRENTKVSAYLASVKLPKLDFSMQDHAQVQFNGLDFSAEKLALTHDGVPAFKLDQANIQGMAFNLNDRQLQIADINLKQGEANTRRDTHGVTNWQQIATAFESPAHDTKQAAENAQPFQFNVANVQLQHWKATLLDESFKSPLQANIGDINIGFNLDNAAGLNVGQLSADFNALSMKSPMFAQPMASIAKVSLQDGHISLNESLIKFSSLAISGLDTQVLHDVNKPLNWQVALEQLPVSKTASNATSNASERSAWKFELANLHLDKSNIHIEDKLARAPVVLDVQNGAIDLRNLSLDLTKPLPVTAKLPIKQGGQLELAGKLTPMPFKSDLQLKLQALSLKPFSPYLNQTTLLKLDDGAVSVNGKVALKTDHTFDAQFTGGFSVDNLALSEEADKTPFLSWQKVSSNSLQFGLAKRHLHMDDLSIQQANGKFIVFEDKSLNVKKILRDQTADNAATPNAQAESKSVAQAQQNTDTFQVDIDRVSINNAQLEFADLSLTPQFGTHINSLSGVINGLSSQPSATAQVELDGKVDEYGSAKIRGSLQPFHATDFTDLKLAFHNIEMKSLTPYSGKFAGRKVDSGKLSVDLEYKIKQRQLAGENKFVINKIKLGERVDSQDAPNLPLDLAIALLEDSDGVIDLDLPISGNLDDPQFSYGKIIWKAFVNVISKIATAPFRALGKLFGAGADKLDAILFEPGKATLAPEEQEKLKNIAAGLEKRPSLMLGISPTVDVVADTAALQELATRQDVANEMGLKIKEGEQAGPIDLNNVKAQSAIENLFKERSGEGRSLKAIEKLKDAFKKNKPEDMPKYASMLEQLKLTAKVTEADLTALGKARAENLQKYLLDNAKLDNTRVQLVEASKVSGGGKSVSLKMQLSVHNK